MIEAKLMREEGILVVSPVDKLESADFERLRLLPDPHGGLKGLLIDAEAFPGWEGFAGLLSHMRFVREYEQAIERVAAVTDNTFLRIVPKVADHFTAAEVWHFEYRDRDVALRWLQGGHRLDS